MSVKTERKSSEEITLVQAAPDTVSVWILGKTPFISNRLAEKARQELLLPRGRLSTAEKASNLKHNPLVEFRSSMHRGKDKLFIPSGMVKGAIRTAALDTEGTKKTEVGRLVWVEGQELTIYGIPQLLMSVVRSADMNRTPDIRTRAIFPRWCVQVNVSFVRPKMTSRNVVTLLHNAGLTCGVGDWRPEKGNGSYGQFTLTDDKNPEVISLVENEGWDAQQEAIERPKFYDLDSEDLFDWFSLEASKREKAVEQKTIEAEVKRKAKAAAKENYNA